MTASSKTAKAATKDVKAAAKAGTAAASEKEAKKAVAGVLEAAKAVKKEAASKTAAKKTSEKTTVRKTVKKAEQKTFLHVQFSGKSYSQEDLLKMAKDVWKYDLKQKVRELTSIELYVKPEENVVYYVMNQDFTGSFGI